MDAKTGIAVNEVLKERERQEELKRDGRFKYTCADPEMSIEDCAIVLGEEFGEFCRAILEYRNLTFDRLADHIQGKVGKEKIKEEAIQLTAVGMAICERLVGDE